MRTIQAFGDRLVSLVVPELRTAAASCSPHWVKCCCQCRSNNRYQCWVYLITPHCDPCCGYWQDQGFRCA